MIIVEYLTGTLNVEEDDQSWSVTDSREWELNPLFFKKICKFFLIPDIDLLASRTSYEVRAYLA